MPHRHARNPSFELAHLVRMERVVFAAKVRLARAVTGLSQCDLAARIGMTQRAIHKIEQGGTEPRRATVAALEMLWREQGIEFEDLADGSFRAVIRAIALENPEPTGRRRGRPPGRRPHTAASGYHRA